MSIWQGSADTTVAPANRTELVKQWAGVHGVGSATPVSDTVDGQSHASYKDSSGAIVVETYEIAGMTHAVPVLPSAGCGTASSYALDKGICAAERIATFFGILGGSGADAGADAKPGSGAVSSSSSTGGPDRRQQRRLGQRRRRQWHRRQPRQHLHGREDPWPQHRQRFVRAARISSRHHPHLRAYALAFAEQEKAVVR